MNQDQLGLLNLFEQEHPSRLSLTNLYQALGRALLRHEGIEELSSDPLFFRFDATRRIVTIEYIWMDHSDHPELDPKVEMSFGKFLDYLDDIASGYRTPKADIG